MVNEFSSGHDFSKHERGPTGIYVYEYLAQHFPPEELGALLAFLLS